MSTRPIIEGSGRGLDLLPSLVRANAASRSTINQSNVSEKQNIAAIVENASPVENASLPRGITSKSNLFKYTMIGLLVGGAAPLVASYATGTHAEMKPIADKAMAIVSFTGVGAALGATLGVVADYVESLIKDYSIRRHSQ